LIVDDNATNRRILYHQTGQWGMQPDLAEDGQTALMLLRSAAKRNTGYDLAILDFHMPGMDGFDLAAIIKSDPQIQATPLVMLTSYGQRGHHQRARAIGIASYLAKPVRETHLHAALAQAVLFSQPAAPSPAFSQAPSSTAPAAVSGAVTRSRGRILVAEDNAVNQKVARRQAEKLGYHADIVANGLEVLEALSRIRYDAILMDCQMPEMDGFEATAAIRAAEAEGGGGRHVPIIAMTANALVGERERCVASGMDDYLAKPVNIELMQELLERWVAPANSSVAS
jgi:two-component system sensor histidine kinase/response regulator